MRLVHLTLVLLIAMTSLAEAGIDPDRLATLETELSTPICGVGYLDTRMGQLDALVPTDEAVDYLDQLARAEPSDDPDHAHRYLPGLAIDLLGRLAGTPDDPRAEPAHEALARLHATFAAEDTEVARDRERRVSRHLAGIGDPLGRELLVDDLDSDSVQVRADTFSALVHLADTDAAVAEAIAPLASDLDGYVVSRVVWDLAERDEARRAVLTALDALETADRLDVDQRGRAAVVRVALGVADDDQAAAADAWLAHYAGAFDADQLDELSELAQLLTVRGQPLGLRAAVHLASLYGQPGASHVGYASNAAIQVFTQMTPFEIDDAVHHDHRAQSAALEAWFAEHGDALRFDPDARRWTH